MKRTLRLQSLRQRPLLVFLSVSIAIWLLQRLGAAYWHAVHATDPNHWLNLISSKRGEDFSVFSSDFVHFHTAAFYTGFPFTYPAVAGVMFAVFYVLFRQPYVTFMCFSVAAVVVAALWFGASLVRYRIGRLRAFLFVFTALALSYPFLFEWQRGNIEIVVWVFTALAVTAFWRHLYWLTAILLGIAGAAKLFPFILLGLLISRKRYWETACTFAVAFAANALSLVVLGPTYHQAEQGIAKGLAFYQANYLIGLKGFGYDHSVLSLIKCLTFQDGVDKAKEYGVLLVIYLAVMAIGGLLVYFFSIQHLPRTNQVIVLVILSVLMPPVSYDYTLIHVYIAWAVLVLYVVKTPRAHTLVISWMFALFAVITSPEGSLYFMDRRIAPQIKCVAMIALVLLALRCPLADNDADDPVLSTLPV